MRLAPAEVDTPFDLQSINAGKLLVIQCESEITIKLNSAVGTAITLKPYTGSGGITLPGMIVLLTDGITAIYLSNAGVAAVYVDVGIAGD